MLALQDVFDITRSILVQFLSIWESSSQKSNIKEILTAKKHSNEQSVAYVSINNRNNPELFTEISKSLDQLKTMIAIKRIRHNKNH